MTDTPGELNEEPEPDRALRERGFENASSGERPVGTSDADESTSIDPQEPDEDAPTLQTP